MTDQIATSAPLVEDTAPPILDTPRIYVACLAAYNNGRLHGRWIEATDPHDVWEQVREMLAASPEPDADEWAIHDFDNFYGCNISEYAAFDAVCDLSAFLKEHGELGAKLYNELSEDLGQARAAFDDYAGEYRSAAEFAEQLHEDTGTEIPESLRYYIDWQALARDMALNGEIMVFQTGFDEVHVFWSH
ncbi:MAG: antirestriction protein ArdA [Henriciella sp.]|nr:antirestriction protein ArdA [Henriciella sp.]